MVTAGCDTWTLGKVKEGELDAGSVAESEFLEFTVWEGISGDQDRV